MLILISLLTFSLTLQAQENVLEPGAVQPSYRNKNETSSDPIQELKQKLVGDEPQIPTRLKLSQLLSEQNKHEEVIVYLKAYADDLPRHGLLLLAKAHHAKEDYLSEIRVLTFMISSVPNDYVGETLLGEAYSANRKPLDAIKHYRAAIKINPRYQKAYVSLLEELQKAKDKAESRRLLEEMVSVFPQEKTYHSKLCAAYIEESFIEKAVSTCREAIELSPKVPENHAYLAFAQHLAQDNEQAQKIINQAAKAFPKSAFVQCKAGEIASIVNNTTGAVKYFKASVALDPSQVDCQLGLAAAAFASEDYEVALKAYLAACKINRSHSLKLRKAVSLLRQKQLSEWQRKYSQAVGQCIEI